MRGRGKRNRFAGKERGVSDATAAAVAAAAAAVSPPRWTPGGGEESARVRDHEKTNDRPHLASNHLPRGPQLPTMPCGARVRHRRLRLAQAQQALPAAGETREGARSSGGRFPI